MTKMKLIDNKDCLENIILLIEPLDKWLLDDELDEINERTSWSFEELELYELRRDMALKNEKQIKNYLQTLTYDFTEKSILYLIITEVFQYIKEYPKDPKTNALLNHWELFKKFKQIIIEELAKIKS